MPTVHYFAGDGRNGSSDGLKGRSGKDVFVRVPIGTTVEEDDLYQSQSELDIDSFLNDTDSNSDSESGYEEEDSLNSQDNSIQKKRKTLDRPKQMLVPNPF